MNPRLSLTPAEVRLLRREAHGKGNLLRLGLISVTDKGRQYIAREDARIKAARAAGGSLGAPHGIKGGRPAQKDEGNE